MKLNTIYKSAVFEMISAASPQVPEIDDWEKSTPNWLIFDQKFMIITINSAGVFVIKSPFLKCTSQEIVVSAMNRKGLLF